MKEPFRFILPTPVRRFLRPTAYKLFPSLHAIKLKRILEIKKKYSIETLVETGTYLGDTIDSVVKDFKKIYSIELDTELYKRAKKIFKNDKNIHLIYGDSSTEIKKLLKKINEPTLFWLDAHYSGEGTARGKKDSPINSEVKAILSHKIKNHIILIDDARFFIGKNGYPKLADLKKSVKTKYPLKKIVVINDMIRII